MLAENGAVPFVHLIHATPAMRVQSRQGLLANNGLQRLWSIAQVQVPLAGEWPLRALPRLSGLCGTMGHVKAKRRHVSGA